VLQHYLATIVAGEDRKNENLGMIDIANYHRNSLNGEKLMMLVKDELSIPARRFFQVDLCHLENPTDIVIFNIQIPYSDDERLSLSITEFVNRSYLLLTVILTNFSVEEPFKARRVYSYSGIALGDLGKDPYEPDRVHAMVLIGMRKTKTGQYYFLLQNWWESKPFVEVSSEYFAYCGGIVRFVAPEVLSEVKIHVPAEMLTMAHAVETDCDTAEIIRE
jgi:hypothetical protein